VGRNVITIEDPIEYHLENVTQHSINEKAGITFASILRTALRQDPDILMVGEVRDQETAEISMQAAMTGHFVYTTLHANDTVSAVFRLMNLKVQPYIIGTSVRGILAQRLVRKLCRACRIPHKPKPDELKVLGARAERVKVLYSPKGCQKCRETGYWGRIGVFELLVFNDEVRSSIQQSPVVTDLKAAAARAGMAQLRDDALEKTVQGIASLEEALAATS
jgi:type II secretory ATPase GspE/PulE/Tfp pilus assembly ATPase PilB-like protein